MKKLKSFGEKMVRTNISFNNTVSNIKKIVDLTLLNPKKFNKFEMSIVSARPQKKQTIAVPFTADYYWLRVVQYVREKSKDWNSILSDTFISNELEELIFQIKTDRKKYGQIGRIAKNWINRLKQQTITNFRFILPINNVDYRKDFDFGQVKLVKITLAKLKKYVPFTIQTGHLSPSKTLKDITSLNQTKIFTIIEVQAKDEKQGMILAKINLKRLIHAMRLFDPPSGITEREQYFPETKHPYMIVNLDKNTAKHSFTNLHLNAHIWRTKEYWKRVDPFWKKLSLFLFSDNLTEVQSLILTGLYWYGEAGKETEDDIGKFLKYTYGLENLVIFDDKYGKKNRMADRLAKIFSKKNSTNYKFYNDLIKQYYGARSGAIHAGKVMVDVEDVGTTHNWLRSLIFDYIRLSKKYTDVKTMFKKEFSITI